MSVMTAHIRTVRIKGLSSKIITGYDKNDGLGEKKTSRFRHAML